MGGDEDRGDEDARRFLGALSRSAFSALGSLPGEGRRGDAEAPEREGRRGDAEAVVRSARALALGLFAVPSVWSRGVDPADAWFSFVDAARARCLPAGSPGDAGDADDPEHSGTSPRVDAFGDGVALANLVEASAAAFGPGGFFAGKAGACSRWRAAVKYAETAARLLARLPDGTVIRGASSRVGKSAEPTRAEDVSARESAAGDAEMGDAEAEETGADAEAMDAAAEMGPGPPSEDAGSSGSSSSDSASDDEDEYGRFRASARRRAAARRAAAKRRPSASGTKRARASPSSPSRPPRPDVARQIAGLLDPGAWKRLVDAALPGEDADDGSWGEDDDAGVAPAAAAAKPFGASFGTFGGAPAPAFGTFGGSSAARGSSVGSVVSSSPSPSAWDASPPSRVRASETGLRAIARLVVASRRTLRSADRGAMDSTLAFGTALVPRAWATFARFRRQNRWPASAEDDGTFSSSGDRGSGTPRGWLDALGVFASAYGTFLLTGDDEEFAKLGKPLPASETPALVATFRDALWRALWTDAGDDEMDARADDEFAGGVRREASDDARFVGAFDDDARFLSTRTVARALAQVHDRNGRLKFADPELFHAPDLFRGSGSSAGFGADGAAVDAFLAEASSSGSPAGGSRGPRGAGVSRGRRGRRRSRAAELLRRAPSLVPFGARVRWFKAAISRDRSEAVGRGGAMEAFGLSPENHVVATRGRVFEDAVEQLGPAVFRADRAAFAAQYPDRPPPGDLRGIVRVRFLNQHGVEEPGVDGGGLFKDFLSALVEEAFDPRAADPLFVETPERTLFPNPSLGPNPANKLRRLEFLGAMLGKAVYEGILVDLPLAGFFLAKLRDGRPPELNDLATLDPELYRHLLSLKRVPAERIESLCLYHVAATGEDTGKDSIVELVPDGENLAVTAENRGRYVHLMAHHLLHARIRNQSAAFVAGFRRLVDPEWLRPFAPEELRLLISGAGGGVDVDDLRRAATYSGGYTADHPTIGYLWEAVREFSAEEQRAFLRFVTACPNTPLLGFAQLAPAFCVHRGGMRGGSSSAEADADLDRLPTAATCMNMLKLPPYASKEQVKSKLLYAVTAGAGFDLS